MKRILIILALLTVAAMVPTAAANETDAEGVGWFLGSRINRDWRPATCDPVYRDSGFDTACFINPYRNLGQTAESVSNIVHIMNGTRWATGWHEGPHGGVLRMVETFGPPRQLFAITFVSILYDDSRFPEDTLIVVQQVPR